MITINLAHVGLYGLAIVGGLALIPKIIRGIGYFVAGLIFLIKGDG